MATVQATATHVERTDDPAVLRWVCHREDLSASPDGERIPPDGSALARLVAEGRLVGVELRGGDLLLRAAEPADWGGLAVEAQEAVFGELGSDALWLLEEPTADRPASRLAADRDEVVSLPTASACAGCHVRSNCGAEAHRTGWLRARSGR
jgi:hypothetical protein